ncbi:GILT-like protein 1 [Arctopsyche grandis]|uniref:GILT-like protein 1 n=1 Tax=Arctopsyche grandis TaxID=121162 RepID=UPI00406D80BC
MKYGDDMRHLIVAIFLLIAPTYISGFGFVTRGGKLHISLYVSSMCKDSQNFITKQVYPVYNELKEYIDVEFVPWGKATTDGSGSIKCQFGARDCDGNKLQSCVMHLLGNDVEKHVHYMNCEYATMAATVGNYQCAYESGISPITANQCFETRLGENLQRYAHAKTSDKVVTFVPTVEYNGVYDKEVSMGAFRDFRGVTCLYLNAMYPGICNVLSSK